MKLMCWAAVLYASAFASASADVPAGTGERLAKSAMALVSFAEFANVGARDPDCQGTAFPRSDVSALVDREVVPVLKALANADRRTNAKQLDQMISMLKDLPNTRQGGVRVIDRLYDERKREATVAFGTNGRCASLSSMAQTVMQQRRLDLLEIGKLLDQGR